MTGEQERWLRAAVAAGDDGVYLPIYAGAAPIALVESGHAVLREVRRVSGARGPRDRRSCEWTDSYLVATALGRAQERAR